MRRIISESKLFEVAYPTTATIAILVNNLPATMKKFFACFLIAGFIPVNASARPVTATVYDNWYNGRTTYCGQTYEHWGVSAAHPWLPCGTRVRVSHRGRYLTVPITDRCDCNSIDLSAGAAYALGVPVDGIATVYIDH